MQRIEVRMGEGGLEVELHRDTAETAVGRDLHEIAEFVAIKVLRNFAHH
ncbi:MAG: hypothetical protein OXC68_02345 [Aestuariivita sp.]|nr:hypothetical protein [Aestuariivita sp.]